MPKAATSSYLRNKKGVTESLDKAIGVSKPAPAPKAKPVKPAVPKRTLKDKIKNVASALTEKQPAPMAKNPTKSRHKVGPDGSSYKVPRVGRRTVDDYK